MTAPAAFNPYELLRILIDRVGWPTEAEKAAALAAVDQYEGVQLFGNLASALACDHPDDERTRGGRCDLCGRQITVPGHHSRWTEEVPKRRGYR